MSERFLRGRALKNFVDYLNNAHRTIQFTCDWSYEEVNFLDVRVINDSGRLETDVYIKPTDSHQYLHHTSCHPNACKRAIPYAQALRLRRICSKNVFFEKRTQDLCSFLVERGYKRKFVEEQIGRARAMNRSEVLVKRRKEDNNRIPFVVTYHLGIPNIGGYCGIYIQYYSHQIDAKTLFKRSQWWHSGNLRAWLSI